MSSNLELKSIMQVGRSLYISNRGRLKIRPDCVVLAQVAHRSQLDEGVSELAGGGCIANRDVAAATQSKPCSVLIIPHVRIRI
jgi:hypothetical protein